jgi:hypothetical protein
MHKMMSQAVPPPKLSPHAKVLVCAGIAGLVSLVGWWQLFRDQPEIFPPGFVLPAEPPKLPDVENGLAVLAEAVAAMSLPNAEKEEKAIVYWREPWDADRMQPFVDAAPKVRLAVEQALRLPSWQERSGVGQRSFSKETDAAWFPLLAKTRELADSGDVAGALVWLELGYRLAGQYQDSPISLSHAMIEVGKIRILEGILVRLSALPGASDSMLKRAMFWMKPQPFPGKTLPTALAMDHRREMLECFDLRKDSRMKFGDILGIGKPEPPPNWLAESRFKPQTYHNLKLRHLAHLDHLLFSENSALARELMAAREMLESEAKLSLWSLDPNRAGRLLAAIHYAIHFKIAESIVVWESARRCCFVAMAAKRWSLANGGRQPADLTELIPRYVESVPLDTWGRPVRWEAATGTAYATGRKGIAGVPSFPAHQLSVAGEEGSAARLP